MGPGLGVPLDEVVAGGERAANHELALPRQVGVAVRGAGLDVDAPGGGERVDLAADLDLALALHGLPGLGEVEVVVRVGLAGVSRVHPLEGHVLRRPLDDLDRRPGIRVLVPLVDLQHDSTLSGRGLRFPLAVSTY
jgi:hypothetical protein